MYYNKFFLQLINVPCVFIYHMTKFENDWMSDTLIIKITLMDEAQNFIKSRIGVYIMRPYAG
jgi:hypothetical protein